MQKRYESLQKEMKARFETVDKRLEAMDKRLVLLPCRVGLGFSLLVVFMGFFRLWP
jgi:hypothetical protein